MVLFVHIYQVKGVEKMEPYSAENLSPTAGEEAPSYQYNLVLIIFKVRTK